MITIQTSPSFGRQRALRAAVKAVALFLLTSCGSEGGQDYSIRFFAVNVSCEYAAEVQQAITEKMQASGIPFSSELVGCASQDWPYTHYEDRGRALGDLQKTYGNYHFFVPKFGIWFTGIQVAGAGLGVIAEGRLQDSVNINIHEILHQFGANHIFEPCNIMGAIKACENPQILETTLREIGL